MMLLSVGVIVLTLTLALARPTVFGYRIEHGTAATLGALLTLSSGLAEWSLAIQTLKLLSFPIITIISLMMITKMAELAGLPQRLSTFVIRAGGGSGHRLFALIFFSGTTMGMVFTNDAAILMFTPLIYLLIERIAPPEWSLKEKLPFYFAVLYVGNLAGLLIISNPINIIVGSFFNLSFNQYAFWMFFPALASVLVSFFGLKVAFRGQIPERYEIPQDLNGKEPLSRMMKICAAVVVLTLIGFFLQGITGIPIAGVAVAGAALLLVLHKANGQPVKPVVAGVEWSVLVFVIGIFIVAMGARNAGLTGLISNLIITIAQTYGDWTLLPSISLIAGTTSAIINNHPTADLMIWVVQDLGLNQTQTMMTVFAALIGGDLGPKMLPIGSLAALMWFRILRQYGVEVSYWRYIKIGVPVTLLAIIVSVAVLYLKIYLAGVVMPTF
jgi:arsenical pump membrane protein